MATTLAHADEQQQSEGPRTILPDPRQTPRFAGISTFCRYPRAEDVDAAHRPIDWLLYGVPFDSGVTYRPGARFARVPFAMHRNT